VELNRIEHARPAVYDRGRRFAGVGLRLTCCGGHPRTPVVDSPHPVQHRLHGDVSGERFGSSSEGVVEHRLRLSNCDPERRCRGRGRKRLIGYEFQGLSLLSVGMHRLRPSCVVGDRWSASSSRSSAWSLLTRSELSSDHLVRHGLCRQAASGLAAGHAGPRGSAPSMRPPSSPLRRSSSTPPMRTAPASAVGRGWDRQRQPTARSHGGFKASSMLTCRDASGAKQQCSRRSTRPLRNSTS